MSIANKNTFHASGSGAATVHIGNGRVYGIIATTGEGTVQTVTLYDSVVSSGAVLFVFTIYIARDLVIFFPDDKPLVFYEGLTIDPSDCDVLLLVST